MRRTHVDKSGDRLNVSMMVEQPLPVAAPARSKRVPLAGVAGKGSCDPGAGADGDAPGAAGDAPKRGKGNPGAAAGDARDDVFGDDAFRDAAGDSRDDAFGDAAAGREVGSAASTAAGEAAGEEAEALTGAVTGGITGEDALTPAVITLDSCMLFQSLWNGHRNIQHKCLLV
ncbi:hypothetical protein ABBQ32_013299 [Trebouxia sp. C0010 RCD-2024]